MFASITGIGLSPNTERDDVALAASEIITPWNWKKGSGISELYHYFSTRYSTPHVFFYNSGRSALTELLKVFKIGKGDEVIVQAFTCIAVPNSVVWNHAVPIFADIDNSYNSDPSSIEKLITKKTKALLVQHTFGIPAQMDEITAIAKKYHLLLIEDCAHALGASWNKKPLGSIGDAAIFSFGRDKVISSVFGGAAIVKSQYKKEALLLKDSLDQIPTPSSLWIFRQLFHPVVFWIILPFYRMGIGKLLLVILQKLTLLSFPVYPEEKCAKQPADFPMKYPPVLARLAYHQIQKLERYNAARKKIAYMYHSAFLSQKQVVNPPQKEGAIYLRYPICVDQPEGLLQKAKEQGVLLGNWYHNIIDPTGSNYELVHYKKGSSPQAEYASTHIVNLPTRIQEEIAEKIIAIVHEYVNQTLHIKNI